MHYRFDLWSGDEKYAIACDVDRDEALTKARRWAACYPSELKIQIVENVENDYFEMLAAGRNLLVKVRADRRRSAH